MVRTAVLLAAAILVCHLPYLPASLEDLDSINFALGLRDFDVARHQPHPPGYPVYILVARAAHALIADPAQALALVSVAGAVLAAFALLALWSSWPSAERDRWVASLAALLAVVSPLFWMTAVRPLSDMLGLGVALLSQALTVRARTGPGVALAALVAGLGVGVRSQVAWLTVPLLAATVWMRPADAVGRDRLRWAGTAAGAFLVGGLAWGIPLLVLSGGPSAYLAALAAQGGEDFSGVAMLATQPSPRLLASALYATWIAPWHGWAIGGVVLVAAAAGVVRYLRAAPTALGWLLVAFGPYAAFHLLFQETATTRYALPLVVPVAWLALAGLASLPRPAGAAVVAAVAVSAFVVTQPAVQAYSAVPAPAFQVLEDMAARARDGGDPPVLAMHRRQELDMRRPLLWTGDRLPSWAAHLAAPPKHEWLELVKFWNAGGRTPVWFLGDPPRSDLRLFDGRAVEKVREYRWPFDAATLLGGVRPNVMDWYRIVPPGWYVGQGWALTPESAGVAREEGMGPGRAPIQAWVRRHDAAVTLMIGGRKLTGADAADVTATVDGRPVWTGRVQPGFFLQFVRLDAAVLAGSGDYAELTIRSSSDAVAIEQFDVQPADRTVFGFGEGWQELEYNPRTGRLWRWSSERAAIRVVSPARPLTLRLDGEFETSASTAHVVVRVGERVVAERDVPRAFTWEVPIPAEVVATGETTILLETDQWYVPADTNWRPTEDRRHLGLRLFDVNVLAPR